MGREIKRVPLDFDWPLNKPWKGFLNPYAEDWRTCPFCKGSGGNEATKQIEDDWYNFSGEGTEWCNSITQDEVDALIKEGRLMGFTHIWTREAGWVAMDPMPVITAELINAWSSRRQSVGHDAINRWICVETRAKRLGVYGKCEFCGGKGELWRTPEAEKAHAEWEREEPPTGEGWQVWETVSEGSPISPVAGGPNPIVQWLMENEHCSMAAAVAFVKSGWCPSAMTINGKFLTGVQSCGEHVTPTESPEEQPVVHS